MKKYVSDFFRRGLISCGFGPIILAIIYLILQKNGMVLSGLSPDGRIVEMIELKNHPFYVATQAHPEFKSRPDAPHPLFAGLIQAALEMTGRNDYEPSVED